MVHHLEYFWVGTGRDTWGSHHGIKWSRPRWWCFRWTMLYINRIAHGSYFPPFFVSFSNLIFHENQLENRVENDTKTERRWKTARWLFFIFAPFLDSFLVFIFHRYLKLRSHKALPTTTTTAATPSSSSLLPLPPTPASGPLNCPIAHDHNHKILPPVRTSLGTCCRIQAGC